MLHYSLRTKAWTLRLYSGVTIAAAIAALYLFTVGLLAHHYPGLGPEPLAFVKQTEINPSSNQYKVTLRSLPDHWDVNHPPALTLDLKNDSARKATFNGTLSANGSCLFPLNNPLPETTLPAHSSATLPIPLTAQDCANAPLPQQLLLGLSYMWSVKSFTTKSKSAENAQDPERLQLPAGDAGKSAPLTLNLSIHLPPEDKPSRGAAVSPARSYAGSITLAPIEVSTPGERAVRRFYRIITSAAKDFTWPILLALLAYATQSGLARRGEQQQILQTLLPTLVELMQTHYLPIARRIQRVGIEMKDFPTLAPPNAYMTSKPLRRTFISILLMRRQILHLVNTKGGVFFRTSSGEDLFSAGVSFFYSEFMKACDNGDLCEKLALKLAVEDLPHQADTKIFPPFISVDVQLLFQNFGVWAIDTDGKPTQKFCEYLILLDLCQAVLSFEFDRVFYQTSADAIPVFRSWYFDSPAFEFTDNPRDIPKEHHATMLPLYRSYLNAMPAVCRRNVRYP